MIPSVPPLDSADRRLLDAIQSEFPLVERPFGVLSGKIGETEEDVLTRVRNLKRLGVIRQISGIFASDRLGYRSVLLAFEASKGEIEQAAQIINAHPGVSHNYERDHAFSLWCTLTVPPGSDPRAHAARLASDTGSARWLYLPAVRLFKIDARFRTSVTPTGGGAADPGDPNPDPNLGKGGSSAGDAAAPGDEDLPAWTDPSRERTWNPADQRVVRALQSDLALVWEPFAVLAPDSGLSPAALLDQARDYLREGVMRRFAAVLRHERIGLRYNVLTVWAVPPERALEVGSRMAAIPEVSHCYERVVAPGWPYSHYAMVHARTAPEATAVVERIARATAIGEYCLLRTVRELKKTRVQYFTPDIAEWEAGRL